MFYIGKEVALNISSNRLEGKIQLIMMKEKITRLKKHALYLYAKNMDSIREKRLKKQKERLQVELMSGSVRRVK